MSLLKDINAQPVTKEATADINRPKLNLANFSMIREFNVQTALKTSDQTDAGKSDVSDRATASQDVGFNLMRNTINSNGQVTGSDVADYIERAEELNDEVDTVPFGLETDDGQIVKVYVNAEQADQFEAAMKNMLGLEDDIEEAINRLTTEFDIVDVVWPKSDDDQDGDGEPDPDENLEIDDTSNLDPDDEDDFAADQYDVIAGGDDVPVAKASTGESEPEEEPEEDAEDEEEPAEDEEEADPDDEESEEEEDEESEEEEDEDGDDDPDKPKKKKKKAQPAEPAEGGGGKVKESESVIEKAKVALMVRHAQVAEVIDDDIDEGEFSIAMRYEFPEHAPKTADVKKAMGNLIKRVRREQSDMDDEVWIYDFEFTPLTESKDPRDEEADSPSTATAIKLMTSQGLHIAAMKEAPGNIVYIEDSQGDEYVLRGDKKLTKEKHGKKLMSLRKEEITQEKDMTIGSRFLARINEATGEDRDGVKDGFNIPLDAQARAMAAKLKLPFAKRLIAFHYMCGVPGRYMNTSEVSDAVAGAADMLRKKVAIRRAFTALYEGMAAAKGYTIPKEGVQEAKKMVGKDPEKIAKAKDAIKAAKKALADHKKTYDGGTGAREKQLQAALDAAMGKLKKLNEEQEQLDEAKQKRGGFIQKLLETVLTELGLPEALITTTGPSAVATGVYKTAELIEQDSTLERALRLLATRMGIRGNDAQAPVSEGTKRQSDIGWFLIGKSGSALDGPFKTKEIAKQEADAREDKVTVKYGSAVGTTFKPLQEEGLDEAVDVGNDDFAQTVTSLVAALGIPDDILARRRTQVVQALRAKKATIRNRAQVLTMIGRLMDVLAKNTEKEGNAPGETNESEFQWSKLSGLSEAKQQKPLEDMTDVEFEKYLKKNDLTGMGAAAASKKRKIAMKKKAEKE